MGKQQSDRQLANYGDDLKMNEMNRGRKKKITVVIIAIFKTNALAAEGRPMT